MLYCCIQNAGRKSLKQNQEQKDGQCKFDSFKAYIDSRGEQPAGLLGQAQTGQQADDEVQDEEQQVGQPSCKTDRGENLAAANEWMILITVYQKIWQWYVCVKIATTPAFP